MAMRVAHIKPSLGPVGRSPGRCSIHQKRLYSLTRQAASNKTRTRIGIEAATGTGTGTGTGLGPGKLGR